MITVADFKAKIESILSIVAMLDPKIALAEAGVEALTGLFGSVSEASTMLKTVQAETEATAPEVAKQVIAFVADKEADWDRSVAENSGN